MRVLSTCVLCVVLAATTLAQRAATSSRVDVDTLLADLQTLSSAEMQGREVGTVGGERARAFVVKRFKESGLEPLSEGYLQRFTVPGSPQTRVGANVIGRLPGARTTSLVISAHYDHLGVRGDRVFPGANDNASGTAALFTLAGYFASHRTAHTLIFVAFDGEEAGLLGSRAFVRSAPVERRSIVANLNIDMIGRDPTRTLYVSGTASQPLLLPPIVRAAADAPVRLVPGHDDARRGDNWLPDSDQFAFLEAGIPALYFGVEDYAHHHRETDVFETITATFYVDCVDTLIRVIEEFDKEAEAIGSRQQSR